MGMKGYKGFGKGLRCRDDGMYVPHCVKSVKVDGITIKADTFYRLENGKFVEVKDDES